MVKGAKVKVRVDTKEAAAKIGQLVKEGQASGGRISKSLEGATGESLTAGAVAGFGFGLGRRAAGAIASAGGLGDVISEATVGFRAKADEFFGGPEVRATRFAREATKDAFAEQVGRNGGVVTPTMRNYFQQIKQRREITEKGRTAIDEDIGMEAVKTMTDQLLEAITKGFSGIGDAMKPGSTGSPR